MDNIELAGYCEELRDVLKDLYKGKKAATSNANIELYDETIRDVEAKIKDMPCPLRTSRNLSGRAAIERAKEALEEAKRLREQLGGRRRRRATKKQRRRRTSTRKV